MIFSRHKFAGRKYDACAISTQLENEVHSANVVRRDQRAFRHGFTRARRGRKWKNAVAFASVGGTAAVFEAQHLYEQWPKLDVDRKRAIVESIFEKVEIGEGKINITYSGLPSSEELCKSQQQKRGQPIVWCVYRWREALSVGVWVGARIQR